MIQADQFTNIPKDLLFAFSSRDDGTMLDRAVGVHNAAAVKSREKFCESLGVNYSDVAYQRIIYDEKATYDLIVEVDSRSTTRHTTEIVGDGLFTLVPGVALFLPVADCIVTVIYDPRKRFLAQLHLGRHSTLTDLLSRMIDHFVMNGSAVEDLLVWMAPSVTKDSYRLDYFDAAHQPDWQGFVDVREDGIYIDMQGHNKQVCIQKGIPESGITISDINTALDPHYFSHSQGDTTGRFAGVSMMRV